MSDSQTNVNDFLSELNGGSTIIQLGLSLSEAAHAAIYKAKGNYKAKISLDVSFTQMGDNDQVIVDVKLSKTIPTQSGKKSEESLTQTPFYVGKCGVLTINQPEESLSGQYNLKTQFDGNEKVRHINN